MCWFNSNILQKLILPNSSHTFFYMVTIKILITCVPLIFFRLDNSALETTRSGHGSSPQIHGAPLYGGNMSLAQISIQKPGLS